MDGLGHAVFVHFRVSAILYALDQGQSSFLSDPLWQDVPWRKKGKTPYDRVYEVLLQAPELNHQGGMLRFMEPCKRLRSAIKIIRRCWSIDSELQSIYESLERSHEGPLFWAELARDNSLHGDSEDGKLFPVAFHFPNLTVANTLLIYWAVQAILWHGMWQLYGGNGAQIDAHLAAAANIEIAGDTTQEGNDADDGFLKLPPLEHRAEFAAPCRNIFQSVEYCLQDFMLDQGPKCIAAPLRMAYETLVNHLEFIREITWAENAQRKVHSRSLPLLTYYTRNQST